MEIPPKFGPWYAGRNNSAAKTVVNKVGESVRYGLRGSLSMSLLNRTDTELGLPGYLHQKDIAWDYADPLSGSPKLWPAKTSEYVSGCYPLRPKEPHPFVV